MQKQYIVYDRLNKAQVGKPYTDIKRARRRVDVLDNIHGGYRYFVKDLEILRA